MSTLMSWMVQLSYNCSDQVCQNIWWICSNCFCPIHQISGKENWPAWHCLRCICSRQFERWNQRETWYRNEALERFPKIGTNSCVLTKQNYSISWQMFLFIPVLWHMIPRLGVQMWRSSRGTRAVCHPKILFRKKKCLIQTGDFLPKGVKTEIAEDRMISWRFLGEKSYEIGCIAKKSYDLRNHSMLWFMYYYNYYYY